MIIDHHGRHENSVCFGNNRTARRNNCYFRQSAHCYRAQRFSSCAGLLPSNELGSVAVDQHLFYFRCRNQGLVCFIRWFLTSIHLICICRHHRHWITCELQLRRRNITTAERIFTLLVESGIIYCLSGVRIHSNDFDYSEYLVILDDGPDCHSDSTSLWHSRRRVYSGQHSVRGMFSLILVQAG